MFYTEFPKGKLPSILDYDLGGSMLLLNRELAGLFSISQGTYKIC